eukprot:TRINITY_DN8781_c0_g1_i1.p1 TRINITY_DN8781_c0_g1~~TRINITY_DN8781_c0_g1_i1.p1  ORF type:complete len:140 (+),score=10.08 TRINITY_DN8781_c0_g1_i1:152-571(+)
MLTTQDSLNTLTEGSRLRARSPSTPSQTESLTDLVPKRKEESTDLTDRDLKQYRIRKSNLLGREDLPFKKSALNLSEQTKTNQSELLSNSYNPDDTQIIRTFDKFTIFWSCKDETDKIHEIQIEIPKKSTVYDLSLIHI